MGSRFSSSGMRQRGTSDGTSADHQVDDSAEIRLLEHTQLKNADLLMLFETLFRQKLESFLAKQSIGSLFKDLVFNSHSFPGTALYNKFYEAYKRTGKKDSSIVFAFHGTPQHNLPSILQNGLDPKFRSRQSYGVGEYFSRQAETSLGYCQGGRKLVVCAILQSGISRVEVVGNNDILVVHDARHHLPVATVEVGEVHGSDAV